MPKRARALSEAELARRTRVWTAMSDLFLDTETRWYAPRTAQVLAQSGYDTNELEDIWRKEAVPEFALNLLYIAGEWAALPINQKRLERRAARPVWRAFLFRFKSVASELEPLWRAVLLLMRLLSEQAPEVRESRVRLWGAFAHAWTEPCLDDVLLIESRLSQVRACGLSKAQCQRLFELEFLPAYKALLYKGESEADRSRNVRELIERAFRVP